VIDQNPSCFLQVLDGVDNPALTLRALSVLVNLHTVADNVTRPDDAEAVERVREVGNVARDVGAVKTDARVLPSTPVTDRHLSSREYLDRLRVKLDRLVRHEDREIRTVSLRLVSLLPAT